MSIQKSIHRTTFKAQLNLLGDELTYDNGTEYTMTAVRGKSIFKEETLQSGSRIIRTVDFLFDVTAFRTATGSWPEDGDTITIESDLEGLDSVTYRVSSVNAEPCYRVDPSTAVLRVHTLEYGES